MATKIHAAHFNTTNGLLNVPTWTTVQMLLSISHKIVQLLLECHIGINNEVSSNWLGHQQSTIKCEVVNEMMQCSKRRGVQLCPLVTI